MRRRRRRRDSRGVTLVELLITVVIMGVIGTTMSATLTAVVIDSAGNRNASVMDAELRRAADAVRAAPYVACVPPPDVPDPAAVGYGDDLTAVSKPSGLNMSIDKVLYWDGTSPTISSDCGSLASDKDLQLVFISVNYNGVTRAMQVVKRPVQ